MPVPPRLADPARQVKLGPHADQSRAVDPGAQLIDGGGLAQDGLVHPLEYRQAVQVDVPVGPPEQSVRQLDHAAGRAVELVQARCDDDAPVPRACPSLPRFHGQIVGLLEKLVL